MREYSIKTEVVGDGLLIDYSNAPCMFCKPKTLGECGHDPMFIDDEWSQAESEKHMRAAGARLAYEREMATLRAIFPEASSLEEKLRDLELQKVG